MMHIQNPAYRDLVSHGLSSDSDMEFFHPRTRDKAIPIYRDRVSGLLALERHERSESYYRQEKAPDRDVSMSYSLTELSDGAVLKTRTLDDQLRRFHQFRSVLEGKRICDFGAGYGGFLSLAQGGAAAACGVELRQYCHEHVRKNLPSVQYAESLSEFSESFDVITLFHVLEHLPQQVATLAEIRGQLKSDGIVVVEVPHAGDFLLQSVDIPEFRDFTFWSEHLLLHTRGTLEGVMRAAGYRDITIWPFQRYGFTNHAHWMLNRRPGGHDILQNIEDEVLERQYREARERTWTADTLMATGRA